MSHMDWAVVRCMDGRLNEALTAFLQASGIPELHDLISVPGGAQDLCRTESGLYHSIDDVSIGLHHIKHILLIQHTDCGAYGGRANCGGTEEADYAFQLEELRKAGDALKQAHPELDIRLALAHIKDDGSCAVENVSS